MKSEKIKTKVMALAICTVLLVAITGAIASGIAEKGAAEVVEDQIYLHSELSPLEPIKDPVYTYWHELYPEYCNLYHLSSWHDDNDDGVLSPCDQIDMTDEETGEVAWYHVDEVTITILVSLYQNPEETMYLDFEGGYEEIRTAMYEPVCTMWHEIYPRFCSKYHLTDWIDNGDQYISYCDYIFLTDIKTEEGRWYHVEEVTVDIVVTPKPTTEKPDLVVVKKWEEHGDIKGTYTVSYVIHNNGTAIAPAGHNTTLYVDGNAIEHKLVPVALEPCETYEDTFRTVVKCTPPEDKITVCADNYDIIDELDEKNNCLTNVWKCPTPRPEITVKTDKFKYCYCNTMNITIDISNPTSYPVTFKWYLGIPTFESWTQIYRGTLPAGFEDTFEVSLHIDEWGETPFSAVWYVDLQDPETGQELAADCACWSYCPTCGETTAMSTSMTPLEDIATEIGEEIEGMV